MSSRSVCTAWLAAALVASVASAACSSADTPASNGTVSVESTQLDGGVIAPEALDVTPSKLAADLTAAGLDPANLPEFDALIASFKTGPDGGKPAPGAAKPVMTLFATSLGIECKACHSDPSFAVPAARRNVVAGMWNKFVRDMRLKQGGLLFCDSCHQGKDKFLVRDDPKALSAWMATNFAGALVSATGTPNTCATCHGDPFNGKFLATWAAGN